jgi:hypothetical protein
MFLSRIRFSAFKRLKEINFFASHPIKQFLLLISRFRLDSVMKYLVMYKLVELGVCRMDLDLCSNHFAGKLQRPYF